jgi:hypothetical protein
MTRGVATLVKSGSDLPLATRIPLEVTCGIFISDST